MSQRTVRGVALVTLLALLLPLIAACGGPKGGATTPPPQSGQGQTVTEPTNEPVAEEPTAEPVEGPSSGTAEQPTDASARISEALGRLTSDDPAQAAFASFHIEVNMEVPGYDSEKEAAVVKTRSLSADVEGENIRIIDTSEEGAAETYIIGDKEYTVTDGEVVEALIPMGGLAWATWQLTPVIVLSIAGLGATPQGSGDIDGRAADVFAVDMADADPAVLEMVQGFIGGGITAATGQVWIDQETGALLKAVLDFEEDITAFGSEDVVGHEAGHIEIEVSQVNSVTVSDPSAD